jgi:dipeptidyl aminopeptidase/acylaminoacyl peptidase
MRRSSASLLALAFGIAAVGFSSGPEAEKPTGRLVFLRYPTGNSVLWTMRVDGTGARRVTRSHSVEEVEPEWSPDGRKIAYSRSDKCHTEPTDLGCNRIWTVNADGSDARRLIPRQVPGLLANRAVSFHAPTWSPDGRRIAYEQSIWESQRSNLYVMNADGSGRRRLTRLRNARSPAWSPDGAKIAFTHRPERGNREIFVLTLKTGKLRRLTRTTADESLPQWSPDGRRIVYQRWDHQTLEEDDVFVMNADGTGQRNLSRRPGLDGGPAWSPGGGLIAFASGGEDPVIYITAADGSGRAQRVMGSPTLATYELDWGPEPG